MPAFRNLFIMRQLLLLAALMTALPLARAAENEPLATNTIVVSDQGTLEILTPKNWTLIRTNLNLPGVSAELHSAGNTTVIRLTIFWDGFGGKDLKPTETEMEKSINKGATIQYLPNSVEKTVTLEKLQGPSVIGSFARFTDSHWNAMLVGAYRNVATGMFRSGNLWGDFDLLTNDKDGPNFNQGLKVMESIRRKP
jgi:hypothetical protein